MKMKPEHFEILKAAISKTISSHPPSVLQDYQYLGHSHMRYRWDMLHISPINNAKSCFFLSDVLYKYLDDTHIDTALKKILGSEYNV